jgi:hypothetical protein
MGTKRRIGEWKSTEALQGQSQCAPGMKKNSFVSILLYFTHVGSG